MTGTLPPLDSVVGGATPERRCLRVHMDPMLLCPGKGLVLPTPNVDGISQHIRFLLLALPNDEMSNQSPFAVHKALIGIGEARKLIVPQKTQIYAQFVKTLTTSTATQTDDKITQIICPPLKLLQRVPKTSSSVLAVSTSLTQANLLMSTSSTAASISETQTPIPTSILVPPSILSRDQSSSSAPATIQDIKENCIKAKATQHRFKLFLENENTELKDLLLHTEVRWLTRGKVLECFINLLPQVKEFVASRNKVYEELENKNWLLDLGFLVDMMMKLNELNLKLQGNEFPYCADMIRAVNSFKCKLELLKAHLLKNSLSHFPSVKRIIEILNLSVDEFDTASYIKTIDTLLIDFSSRFQDFLPLESVIPFFVNPFNVYEPDLPTKISNYFDVTNMHDLEMEIINLQNDIVLKSHYVDKSIWKLVTEESFPILRKCTLKIFSYCGTTYNREALFSTMTYLKSKY
ncbi:general transcription factor II-I repeat domain-containing protein 2B [Trichonephila clavipes]|nr:general transcription factor II-I repeat domain-containing protein 2B [Trichonephila clavipes]